MTSHSTSSSTRLSTESRSPKTSSTRPGGMTSFASTLVSVAVSVLSSFAGFQASAVGVRFEVTHHHLLLIPVSLQSLTYEGSQLPPLGASSGEGHRASHNGPHVLQPGRAGLFYRRLDYLLKLLRRERLGQVSAHDSGLRRLRGGLLLAAGPAKRLRRLLALLELAPQDDLLLLLRERPAGLNLRVLERRGEHPQGAHARPVPLLHGCYDVLLYLLGHSHGISRAFPPRTCRCRWKTPWPASGPLLIRTA